MTYFHHDGFKSFSDLSRIGRYKEVPIYLGIYIYIYKYYIIPTVDKAYDYTYP